jgi:hypothetical protein
MPEQKEPPRPHGDPLEDEVMTDRGPSTGSGPSRAVSRDGSDNEPNAAQRQSDATNDASSLHGVEQPTAGTTSDANGISAADEADGAKRKKQYGDGAELVSRID